MRRLLRILVNVATVLSALLAVAAVGLWFRGYFALDTISRRVRTNYDVLGVSNGTFAYFRRDDYADRGDADPVWTVAHSAHSDLAELARHLGGAGPVAGFYVYRGGPPPRFYVTVPCWAVVAVFAALPLVRGYRRYRRGPRRRPGHCRACGYDLRATPNQCPECGAVPKAVNA